MHETLREIYRVYSAFSNLKSSLLFIALLVAGVYHAYTVSAEDYLWAFILASLILLLVFVNCARKFLTFNMRGEDFVGNVFTTGLFVYFSLVIAMALIKS